jgi:hypothetical protein
MVAGCIALILVPLWLMATSATASTALLVASSLAMVSGLVFLMNIVRMWHKSQGVVDAKPPIQSQVTINADGITLAGGDALLRDRGVKAIILEAMARLHHQAQLPPAYGRVNTDATGSLEGVRFTEDEAMADAKQIADSVSRDHNKLKDGVRTLLAPSQQEYPALQRPVADSEIVEIDTSTATEPVVWNRVAPEVLQKPDEPARKRRRSGKSG